MGFIDIVIIVSIIFFAIVGFNNGFFKGVINLIGLILSMYGAFVFRNTVANLMILHLPFLDFGSVFKASPVLNVLFYNLISYIILFTFLELLYNVLVNVLGLNEKATGLTVRLKIPAKLLGIISGLAEGVIIVFLAIIILKQPFILINIIGDSKVADEIARNTPLISDWNRDFINCFDGITELVDSKTLNDSNAANILIQQNMLSKDTLRKLIDLRKVKQSDELNELLNTNTN